MVKLLFRPLTWKVNPNHWPEYGNGWYLDTGLQHKPLWELRELIHSWQKSPTFATQYMLEHPDGTLELFLEPLR